MERFSKKRDDYQHATRQKAITSILYRKRFVTPAIIHHPPQKATQVVVCMAIKRFILPFRTWKGATQRIKLEKHKPRNGCGFLELGLRR